MKHLKSFKIFENNANQSSNDKGPWYIGKLQCKQNGQKDLEDISLKDLKDHSYHELHRGLSVIKSEPGSSTNELHLYFNDSEKSPFEWVIASESEFKLRIKRKKDSETMDVYVKNEKDDNKDVNNFFTGK